MNTTELTIKNLKLQDSLNEALQLLNDYQSYFMSDKFTSGEDYAHVKTDIMPKIMKIKMILIDSK